jgi:hypothetical protein
VVVRVFAGGVKNPRHQRHDFPGEQHHCRQSKRTAISHGTLPPGLSCPERSSICITAPTCQTHPRIARAHIRCFSCAGRDNIDNHIICCIYEIPLQIAQGHHDYEASTNGYVEEVAQTI